MIGNILAFFMFFRICREKNKYRDWNKLGFYIYSMILWKFKELRYLLVRILLCHRIGVLRFRFRRKKWRKFGVVCLKILIFWWRMGQRIKYLIEQLRLNMLDPRKLSNIWGKLRLNYTFLDIYIKLKAKLHLKMFSVLTLLKD